MKQETIGEEWHVFALNDCDWWLARTLQEAKLDAIKNYSNEADYIADDAHQLTAVELEKHRFKLDDERVCPECNQIFNVGRAKLPDRVMRLGTDYAHQCGDEDVIMNREISFKRELDRRIAAGPKPEMFASTEA